LTEVAIVDTALHLPARVNSQQVMARLREWEMQSLLGTNFTGWINPFRRLR
jgi:hypothetical protein